MEVRPLRPGELYDLFFFGEQIVKFLGLAREELLVFRVHHQQRGGDLADDIAHLVLLDLPEQAKALADAVGLGPESNGPGHRRVSTGLSQGRVEGVFLA